MAKQSLERLQLVGLVGVWCLALIAAVQLAAIGLLIWLPASVGEVPRMPLREIVAVGAIVIVCVLVALNYIVIRPSRREWERLLQRAAERRDRYAANFLIHPDAIVVYNLDGTIKRGNPSAFRMLGADADLVGKSWREHVEPRARGEMDRCFQASCAGEVKKFETTFLSANAEEIPVEGYLVPTVVNGAVVSVVGNARDMRQLRNAHAREQLHIERLSTLAEIKSDYAAHPEDQVRRIIEFACATLGMEEGAVSTVSDSKLTVTHSATPYVKVGLEIDMELTFARHCYGSREALAIDDTNVEPWCVDAAVLMQGWKSYIGATIFVEGKAHGIISFTRRSPRGAPFERPDSDFVRMAGSLVGSALERSASELRLAKMAQSDPVTGLLNRVAFEDHLRQAIARVDRHGGHVRLHFIDLDGFKPVNDLLGHAAGDEALRIMATRLRALVRTEDVVARIGGDEFVVLESTLSDEGDSTALGDRIVAAAAELMYISKRIVRIGASVGVASYPRDAKDDAELLECADSAMYSAKSAGKGSVKLYSYG